MRENRTMSVFEWHFTLRYTLRHPLRVIRWFFTALRMAKQRAVYGWCDSDARDWYNWAGCVLAGLLTQMSDELQMSDERSDQLARIADNIYKAAVDTSEYDACDDVFKKAYEDPETTQEERSEALKQCLAMKTAVMKAKKTLIAQAFSELGSDFFDFWK